jgi:predicted negative regulator of RcsB-dependent stress response
MAENDPKKYAEFLIAADREAKMARLDKLNDSEFEQIAAEECARGDAILRAKREAEAKALFERGVKLRAGISGR